MSSLLYKGHSIIYGAILDVGTRRYAPTAQIVWHAPKGKHDTHSFTLIDEFDSVSEAKATALQKAMDWADQRLASPEQPKRAHLENSQDYHESQPAQDYAAGTAVNCAPPRSSRQ
jgi:hypothetical protein